MPYLRPSLPESKPDVTARAGNAPVLRDLGNGLLIAYVLDVGDHFQYLQWRDLEDSGLNESELHEHAVYNLTAVANEKLRVEPHDRVFAAFLDGNFEASLLLIDDLWDKRFASTISHGFVAAVPARDIIAFCDATSSEGIAQLCQIVARANKGGDHLLTSVLYRRQEKQWVQHLE
jgi:uncharacterized protein YtpQ (UPF0354 family)